MLFLQPQIEHLSGERSFVSRAARFDVSVDLASSTHYDCSVVASSSPGSRCAEGENSGGLAMQARGWIEGLVPRFMNINNRESVASCCRFAEHDHSQIPVFWITVRHSYSAQGGICMRTNRVPLPARLVPGALSYEDSKLELLHRFAFALLRLR